MQDDRLAGVRAQRASLRRAFASTEQALAAPLSGRLEQWRAELAVSLEQLRSAWDRHVTITEGDEGLFAQIRVDAPQLAPSVRKLHDEHEQIRAELDDVRATLRGSATADDLSSIRSQATAVLSGVMRHRQRGSDLVYEAYQRDIGGE